MEQQPAEQPKEAKKKKAGPSQTPADAQKYSSKKAWEHHKKMKRIRLHQEAAELHGFDVGLLVDYPHRVREGDIPVFLLQDQKKKMNSFEDIQKKIQRECDKPYLLPTKDHVQLVYERFCEAFKAAPLTVLQFYHDGVLSFENYGLEMEQVKAICCTIPAINGLKEIRFVNNNLSDEMNAILIMAAYMSPSLDSITISRNSLQKISCKTMRQLQAICPSKLKGLDLDGCADVSYHLENIISDMGHMQFIQTQTFRPGQALRELCLSNIPLAGSQCRHIGDILTNADNLKQLELQACKISGAGMRFILDGLNRNVGLQFVNLSHNSLVSKIYEFAIKLAKVVCSHEDMVHVDLTNTGLRPEEVIFIGMTLPLSKSCMGIHLSANRLGYYERVFLRTLIDAKVQYHFKNVAQRKNPAVKKKAEEAQMLELNQQDYLEE